MSEPRKINFTNLFGILVSVLAAIITLLFGTGDSITGILILLGIFVFVLLFFLISWPIYILSDKLRIIDANSDSILAIQKDLNSLKQRMHLHKNIADLKARVTNMELSLMKKGQIDPRWIIILIIIILMVLFLRQRGVF